MSNIDRARNGIFRNLDRSVFNSSAFVNFINSLRPNKLEDKSFVGMINRLDASVLIDDSFIRALSRLHDRDDDILTNSKFSGAVLAMRDDFLRSAEFGQFTERLDANLLESRTARSIFSGQLKAEYFEVLSNSLTYENLQDESLNDFINKIDVSIFNDGSFANFMATTEAYVLTDGDFTEAMGRVSDAVLTNGHFTEDVQSFNAEVRTTNLMSSLIFGLSDRDLARREGYESILDLNANSAVVADNGGTIELNPNATEITQRPTYGLDFTDVITGGVSYGGASTTRTVGFQEIEGEGIAPTSQTWVIVHGFSSSSEGENIQLLAESVREHAKANDRVLLLDWREAAINQQRFGYDPYTAMTWGTSVAEYAVKTLINEYGLSADDAKNQLNLVGHSLGAYVASEIGRVYRDGLSDDTGAGLATFIGNGTGARTLTALDPASGLFLNDITVDGEDGVGTPFDVDGSRDGIQRPEDFRDVARFSRAFNGSRSIAGNEAAAATAHEAILVFLEGTNLLDQHSRVVQAFANIDNQSGRISKNLGIEAYASTSGTLPLENWEDIDGLPLSNANRNATAILLVDENNQSIGLSGQPQSEEFDQIFIGGDGETRVPNGLTSSAESGLFFGEGGTDYLTGGIGSDVLVGGGDTDFLTGGGGSDTFVFSLDSDIDFISDFSVIEKDKFGLAPGLNYSDLIFGDDSGGTAIGRVENGSGIAIAFVENVSSDVVSSPNNFIENYPLDPFGLA